MQPRAVGPGLRNLDLPDRPNTHHHAVSVRSAWVFGVGVFQIARVGIVPGYLPWVGLLFGLLDWFGGFGLWRLGLGCCLAFWVGLAVWGFGGLT